jgi:hypothetical protein
MYGGASKLRIHEDMRAQDHVVSVCHRNSLFTAQDLVDTREGDLRTAGLSEADITWLSEWIHQETGLRIEE